MNNVVNSATRALRAEVQRLTFHREDTVFMVQELDRFQAFMRALEAQHAEVAATVGTMSAAERQALGKVALDG